MYKIFRKESNFLFPVLFVAYLFEIKKGKC